MSKSGFAADRLKSFINRIERLEEERDAFSADIREVYSEAKGDGFDTKIMRQVVRLRKMDKADFQEYDAMLDLYLDGVGLRGTPLGSYAAQAEPPHDPETGEIHESQAKADDEVEGSKRGVPSMESVSRPDARRSASTTSEDGRDRAERRPPPDDDLELPACLDRREKVLEHA